ncbi:MAG: GTPase HflX [Anaerolineae bacterium]|nr:GTPase HflX [Anaerolineae bacterium]
MSETHQITHEAERAFLVGAQLRGTKPILTLSESLQELAMLADTAGMVVVGETTQMLHKVDSATFIGSGKVQEVIEAVEALEAQAVIFDDELSPRHQRELSKKLGDDIKLLDRSALILDIFAQHASTREGALQVELAQYEYRLPRLTRQWTHLARQAGGLGGSGGVGVRGPGETQLEVDKREIGRKITKLKEEIEKVRQHRRRHRQQRQKTGIPVVALVGYTNAGKSTLINALSNSDIYVADQLFATLDPTTRRIVLPSSREVLISDTVGFIQKLPTTLIAAFRATLEEIVEADLILHIVDVSHPSVLSHIETVEDTLAEIDVIDVPRILVWNKMDNWDDAPLPQIKDSDEYIAQVYVSAKERTGFDNLLQSIADVLVKRFERTKLLVPYDRGDVVSLLFQSARVLEQEHTNDGIIMDVELPVSLYERYRNYEYVEKSDVQAD